MHGGIGTASNSRSNNIFVGGRGAGGSADSYEIANQSSFREDEQGTGTPLVLGRIPSRANDSIMTETEDENDLGNDEGGSITFSSDHEHRGQVQGGMDERQQGRKGSGMIKNIHKGGVDDNEHEEDIDSDVSSFNLEQEIANTPKKWYETKCARTLFYIMGILYMFPWGTVFFVVAALTVVEIEHKESRQHPATHTNRSLQYEHMAQLDSKMYLYWNNPNLKAKTVDLHVVYYGIGWVSLGVSPNLFSDNISISSSSEEEWNNINLEGGEAVIGMPLKTPPVQLYELSSSTFSFDSVHLKPKSEQRTIQDTLLVQSSTKTELSFIMRLDPPPRVDASEPSTLISIDPEGETSFIYAYGASNAFGHVLDAGLYNLDFAKYAKTKDDADDNSNGDEDEEEVDNEGATTTTSNSNNDDNNSNNADNTDTSTSSNTVTTTTNNSSEEEEEALVNEMTTPISDIYTADDGGASNHHKNPVAGGPSSTSSSGGSGGNGAVSSTTGDKISCVTSQDPAYEYTFFPTKNEEEYFISYRVDEETNTLYAKMAYHKPNRWLGWGLSPDGSGSMIGSHAIIGFPNDDDDESNENSSGGLYSLNSKHVSGIVRATTTSPNDDITVSYSNSMNTSNSVMTFTTKLPITKNNAATSTPLTVIWAVGSSDTLGYHEERGSYNIVLSTCSVMLRPDVEEGTNYAAASNQSGQPKKPIMALLYLHGVLMAIAFLILVPLSVSFALLRHLHRQYWFFSHMGLNILAGCLSAAGFLSAILAIGRGNYQISHFGSTHQIVGLIILILVAIQISAALLRPQSSNKNDDAPTNTSRISEVSSSPLTQENSFHSHRGSADIDLDDWFGDLLDRVNCSRRLLWQTCHSYNGTLILILGLVQVYDGMDKLETSYGVRWKVTALFWAIIVPWLVTLSLLMWIQRGKVQSERTTQRGDILPDFATHMEDIERHDMLVPAVVSHHQDHTHHDDDDDESSTDDEEQRHKIKIRSPKSFV